MLKKFFVLMFLTVVLTWSACKKDDENDGEVKAAFTFEITANPGEVVFTNRSSNAQIYSWDFGDGKQNTQKDPTHVYDENADFIVKLTATGSAGSNSVADTVTVNNIVKK